MLIHAGGLEAPRKSQANRAWSLGNLTLQLS